MSGSFRREQPDQANRRNHYRVLHVQPDAPFDVIRASYRTLLQTLKLHPDLGGDHWTAAHVNAAYHVLSDPLRRAQYDRELLATYHIATLSDGPLRQPRQDRPRTHAGDDRRNYYRLLQVQPDAPIELIEASYRTLTMNGVTRSDVLDLAVATLRDPVRRAEYDRSLRQTQIVQVHADIIETPPVSGDAQGPAFSRAAQAYAPLVTRFCHFCKTPHETSESALGTATCAECGSPLSPPPATVTDNARRSMGRMRRQERIGFYSFWPGERQPATLVDVSPRGMSFETTARCQVGDVLKIETPHLQAVGVVARATSNAKNVTVGVEFRTVGFTSLSGSFISARA
ncbi:MAG: DnaJ domain-containing protein [Vicinamibacterales bacterium]